MKEGHFFDKPENVKKVLGLFYVSLLVLIIMDLFIPKDPHLSWEAFPAFYATYGFVACVALVLGAKYILRKMVKRKENYYD